MDVFKNKNLITINDNNKELIINLMENGDLYWTLNDSSDSKMKFLEITKKDYQIYELFEMLYNDIKLKKIYDVYEEINLCSTKEHLLKIYRKYEENNKFIIEYEDLNSYSSITWVSDNNIYNISNSVTILKEEDKFILIFNLKDYQSRNTIRFSNSSSRYKPYNKCFMKHFYNLYNLNINREQIHLEEYIYLKKVKRI